MPYLCRNLRLRLSNQLLAKNANKNLNKKQIYEDFYSKNDNIIWKMLY